MKIAYVYDAVHPWETGGVQKRVWELARRLADQHDVHWYGFKYWEGSPVVERDGVTLHGVGDPPNLYVDGRRSITEAISFAAHLIPELDAQQFDLIDCQVFPYFSCFSSKLRTLQCDTTLLFTWHEVWDKYWTEYLGWKGICGRIIERLATKLPDAHIAVSQRTQDDVRHLGVLDTDLYYLPNGISLTEITTLPQADRGVDVLFVGRFIKEKNPGLVVKTIKHLQTSDPKVQCIMVGDGPERKSVEDLASENGLDEHIHFTGRLENHEEVLGLMKAADVLLHPSEREGFGITVLEALGCGTPVVTANHHQNAASSLISNTTGAVCTLDPEQLAEATIEVMEQPAAHDCRTQAEAYDWRYIADQAESIYEEVV